MSKAKEAWELEPGSRSALDRKEGGKGLLNNPAWATAPPPIRRPPRAEALLWWTCLFGIKARHDPNAKDSQGPKTPPELPFCWMQEPPINATEPIDGRSSIFPTHKSSNRRSRSTTVAQGRRPLSLVVSVCQGRHPLPLRVELIP
jgi:hypothetical protein